MILHYKGCQLFYEDKGAGPVICLLHGFLENHSMWDALTEHLQNDYRIITPDLPGHGESEVLPGDNTMEVMAEALHYLLGELGIVAVKLVGHSMGGYVALAFAKAYQLQTKGVLLMNSTPAADTSDRKEMREHGIRVAQKNYEALVSMSVSNLFSEERRDELRGVIEETKKEALKTPAEGYIACQKGMMQREDLGDFWAAAGFKKAMILGLEDTLINARAMEAEYSRNHVEVYKISGGHMSHLENFEQVMEIIPEFLSD